MHGATIKKKYRETCQGYPCRR